MKNACYASLIAGSLTLALFTQHSAAQQCALNGGEPIKPIPPTPIYTSLEGVASLCGFDEFVNPSTPPKKYRKYSISGQITKTRYVSVGGCPTYPASISLSVSSDGAGLACPASSTCSADLISDNGTTVTYSIGGGGGGRLILDGNVVTPGERTFVKNGGIHTIGVQIYCYISGGWVGLYPYENFFQVPGEVTIDTWAKISTYSSSTCVLTSSDNSTRTVNGVSEAGPFSMAPTAAYPGLATVNTLSSTLRTTEGTGTCTSTASQSSNATGTIREALTDEDTVADAEKRAVTSTGSSNTAFRTSRGNGYTWSFRKVHYEAEFNVDCAGEYDAVVTYSIKPHGTSVITGYDYQVVRKTLQPGKHTINGDIRVLQEDTDYTVESMELRKPCDKKPPSSADFRLDSVHVEFSLGLGERQESAGFISLQAESITSAQYTPEALTVATADRGVEVVRMVNGSLRQIKAPQTLADIVTIDASSYEVRFYAPGVVGAQDPGTKIYTISGTPYAVFKFENPDAAQTTRLRITETRGSVTRVNEYAYASGTNTWSLNQGNGLRNESLLVATAGSDTTKTSTIRDSSNNVVSKTAKIYHAYPWGKELISEVLDPDGAALTTSYEFYSNALGDGGAYGRLKQRTNANGSWERRTYDSTGRPLKTIRPYLDAAVTAVDSFCRVTDYVYSSLADADGDGLPELLTTSIETTLGTETGRSYELEWSKPVTLGTETFARRSDIRCVTYGAAWNATDNLVTETLTYTVDPLVGRTRRVLNPDGTCTLATYTLDTNGQQTAVIKSGVPNATRDDITDGTRTTTYTSPQGQLVGETVTDISSGLALSSWTATQFDSLGRPTRLDYTDGTYETRDYACCGLASSRDRAGIVTSYQYDALGRPTDATRNGLTTHTTYDADGRVKTVSRIGTDNSSLLQETNTYDLAGRLTWRHDALSRATGYNEVFDAGTGRTTRTTTGPDGGTSIQVTARDGSTLSVSGTAAAPRSYEYGIEAGQLFTKEIRVGQGGATTEWTKTYVDFVGRGYKTVLADNATTQSYFNAGQLVRQVDPDGIATLYSYNARGEQETSAVDLNANGAIDYTGTDRITKTVNSVATNSGVTVKRTTTQVWETDGQDTPVTVSVSDQGADGLRSWLTVRGLATTSVTVLDGSGGRTVTTTGPDGVKTVQVYSGDRLASTTVKTATDVQLAAVSYGYDSHGRLQTSTDARNGATTYAYFADDQILSVTTPDPDPARSGPGYDPQTTTYHYDSAGRPDTVTQPDGTVVNTTYWPTGAVRRTWGSRTYPTEYTYDPQGRVKTLTTWQDFAGNSGQAVTTWNYNPQRGWLDNKRYADNTGPTYTYKPSGRLLTRTWARGIITNYAYTAAGDISGVTYTDGTPAVTIDYDRSGRPKTMTDGSGSRTISYHTSGQLEDEGYTAGLLNGLTVDRTIDALHRLSGVAVPSISSTVYGYDAASRLQTVTAGANTATYGYLANSQLVQSVTFAQGGTTRLTTTKVYDNLSRLSSISNQPGASSLSPIAYSYTYNSANQRTRATREDNAYWNYTYDALGQVTSGRKYLASGVAINGLDHAWTFDDIGNRRASTINGHVSTYTANTLNQYSQRTVPGALDVFGAAQPDATVTVTFPASGGTVFPTTRQGALYAKQLAVDNSTASQYAQVKVTGVKNLVGPNREDAVTEEIRSVLVSGTPEPFAHDADGNLTDDARWHYTWDGENRLIAMETGASAAAAGVARQKLEFAYDGQGRRIAKKVHSWSGSTWTLASHTLFLYDGWNLIAELNALSANAAVRTYVWGLDLSGSLQGAGGVGGLLFAQTGGGVPSPRVDAAAFDGNGNVIGYVDMATGITSATYEYGAFGETLIADGVAAEAMPFRFSTRYTDNETGIIMYPVRPYLPWLGRFGTHDPIEEKGGANLYTFVDNNAINRIDPLGLWSPEAHNYFLDYAFRTRKDVSREKIEIMQAASRAFDIATATGSQYANMHSMAKPGQTPEQARAGRDAFVMSLINEARKLRKACRIYEAHQLLGQALHPVMDSTSPEHVDEWGDPKVWRGTTRSGYGHSPGYGAPWYLKVIGYEGDETPRDAAPQAYYSTAAKLNYYYDLYLQD